MPDPIAKIGLSRFAQRVLAARPELAGELSDPQRFTRDEMLNALGGPADDEFARELRRLRNRVLLRVMARDLSGQAGLDEVCGTMTDLAEVAIATSLDWAEPRLRAELGTPRSSAGRAQELLVVGMGKLGGRELNVSSDIDLVFVYPEEGETDGPHKLTNHEYFDRLGRRLIGLLAEITEDGFVFRVDMRLRPYGDSGALATSFDALEAYLVAHGREWERYAWIKARALSGERHDELAAIVRPFVFRKYLDYPSLAAMRRLHAEVRRDVARRELAEHVKLGPGGIREIEFVAQALQLIRGGRDPALTVRPTLQVLGELSRKRLLPENAARELSDAYVFLRNLEHRLQYLDDRQTHTLPEADEDRARIATMCGFSSWQTFYSRLESARAAVARHFQDVLAESEPAGSALWQDEREAAVRELEALGFRDAPAGAARLAAARSSQRYALLPEDSKRRFDALVPALVSAAAATADPDATLGRGLDLIEALARRAAYLALLTERPDALERVARMIGASSWAAELVTRHPLLLDELLDERLLEAPPDWLGFERALRALLAAAAGDPERQMNILREEHRARVFRLLAQDLAGALTVERLADHLSELADRVLGVTLELVWPQLQGRHRERSRFAVIGYGKLGGKELGYASDLDLIFLYDDDDERAPENYARLARRMNHWLTSHTSSGVLFETDLRLRPSGESGLLVSSVSAFDKYQDEMAWVWEHQALTRARYCAGDAEVGRAFESIRERILRRPRDPVSLAKEILAMREKMHTAHPNRSGLFDVKHDRGGMIDIEFTVQFLVLAHAHRFPDLTKNLGNIALLKMASEHALIASQLAERCRNAYREFRRIQHSLRLNGASYARVPPERVEPHVEAVRALWSSVLEPQMSK
jgi:[glutamine synthetase] adenylyltransferase / [glutamine synthetase]-adenylyl-L-tyrosine phosphorylase